MNLAVHELEGKIAEAITYDQDEYTLVGKCDFVMANPPFNVDLVDARLWMPAWTRLGRWAQNGAPEGALSMTRLHRLLTIVTLFGCAAFATASFAQELAPIALPAPSMEGGQPLATLLKQRASTREFAPDALPPRTLANLLWAAWGINRPDGRRTAPSASNRQEIEIYVILPAGAYRWDAKSNVLNPVAAGDHRAATGSQPYVGTAALNLVYVADTTKLTRPATDPQQMLNIGADTGFISQNVSVVSGSFVCDRLQHQW